MDDKIKDIDTLIVRYLQGTSTEEEKMQFLSWLTDDNDNEVSFHEMKEIFDMRKRIPKLTKTSRTNQSKLLQIRPWMRYAAIIAIMFGASFIFYLWQGDTLGKPVVYTKQIVIHNTRGVYQVTLPDGSSVWLHGGTTLTYPEQFSDSLRMVDLQGEAYFAVQADVNHPFVVQTPTAKIRATGTEFNITAYPDDPITTTTLIKGIVDVKPNHLSTSVELKPNQQALVSGNDANIHVSETNKPTLGAIVETAEQKQNPVNVKEVNAELYTDWKDGVYRFKNEPFQNIVLRLEKMYGVDIQIGSEDLKKTSFSGMFTTDYSLKEVFEIINISNPITYRVENKVVYIKNKKN